MQKLMRVSFVVAFVIMLAVGATVTIGKQVRAGDPCITVVPTTDPGTSVPTEGVTETVDAGTVTPEPTNTEEVPTETNTAIPTETATEIPPTETLVPTAVPTETFPQPASVGNQFAGVQQSGNTRALYQDVSCETPSPEATSPVTELPNTGSGPMDGGSNLWILIAVLVAATGAVAFRMRAVVKQ